MTFIERIGKAVTIAKQKGAILNREAVIAQATLESGWGRSLLTQRHNNLFGIKAGSSWKGKTVLYLTEEWTGTNYITVRARWRVYPSYNECLVDYSHLIHRLWWYQDSLPFADPPQGNGDMREWLRHLVDRDLPGELTWATGPNYVVKVMNVHHQIRAMAKKGGVV